MFDASNFMNTVYTEVGDTKRIPCPAGEFQAQIEKVEPRSGTIGKGDRMGETWAGLNIQWTIMDEAVKALTGRDKTVVFQSLMLDLTSSGGLDFSPQRNIQLGQLREACRQNTKGQPWSPTMLTGQVCKIMVRHVPGFKDPSELVAEVSGVVRA